MSQSSLSRTTLYFSTLYFSLGLSLTLSACAGVLGGESPTVKIAEPAEGSEFTTSDTIQFVFDVDDFELDAEAVGDAPEAGHGHIHLFLDDGENALKTSASASLELDLSTIEITPGLHTFRAVLFENDHSEVEVAVSDAVEIIIAAP